MRQSCLPFGEPRAESSSTGTAAAMPAPVQESAAPTDRSSLKGKNRASASKDSRQPLLFPLAGSSSLAPSPSSERAPKRARSNINGGSTTKVACSTPGTTLPVQPIRSAAPQPVPDTARLWTDISRPQRAKDVLGNEAQATYLCDWLHALQIVAKQPREPSKAKGKDRPEPAFCIGRTPEEEAWFDQFRRREATTIAGGATAGDAIAIDQISVLSNVIVLTGPSGSGKTAAVYACASELGFEVFELYPGMGRRAGKDIQSAVGDLGRNHMVSSGGTGGGAFRALNPLAVTPPVSHFFQKQQGSTTSTEQKLSSTPDGRSAAQPRQSLILLEEVDVLYADDKGFWPAVIDLVGDSRRPIVLTCQDLLFLPLQELAVQRILTFEHPQPSAVVPYLVELAAQRGQNIAADAALQLYTDTRGRAEHDDALRRLHLAKNGPLHPATSIRPTLDLRQTILQLQYQCHRSQDARLPAGIGDVADSCQTAASISLPTLRSLVTQTEHSSFADAHLRRPFDRAVEMLEPDQYHASADDIQTSPGFFALHKPLPASDAVALPMYGREHEFRHVLEGDLVTGVTMSDASFDMARLNASAKVDDAMAALLVPPISRVPAGEAVLDYAPFVRAMVSADDAEEAAHEARIQAAIMEVQDAGNVPSREGDQGYDLKATNAYQRASDSLSKLGIRPSRHTTKMLLQRGGDGLLELTRREADFCRWLLLDTKILNAVRSLAFDTSTFPEPSILAGETRRPD